MPKSRLLIDALGAYIRELEETQRTARRWDKWLEKTKEEALHLKESIRLEKDLLAEVQEGRES